MVALADKIDSGKLDVVCRRYRVRKMWIFGSFARGEERSDSDVDVLLEFEDEFTPTLLDVAGLAEDLRPAFGGRQIDLGRPGQLHWYVRDRVLREAKEIYAR